MDRLGGESLLCDPVRGGEQGTGVAGAQLTVADVALHRRWQLEKPQTRS